MYRIVSSIISRDGLGIGISIDAQKEKLHQYAELYNIELIDIKVDAGQSAKSLDRVGLEEALATLGTGNADALLIYKLDRLTRSVADLGRLIDKYFNEEYQLLVSVRPCASVIVTVRCA